MGLESTTTIEGLDQSYPLGSDFANKGDDHLRLIKNVLKTAFPGAGGQGFNTPITATEAEINYLSGATSNIQTQINTVDGRVTALEGVLSATPGTKMAFHQAAAPTGWTQDVTITDHMMRVVSTAGGGTGGSDSPILNDKVPTHNHVAVVTDPGHVHGGNYNPGGAGPLDDFNGSERYNMTRNTDSAITGISVAINNNVGGSNWTPKYTDMIIASKD